MSQTPTVAKKPKTFATPPTGQGSGGITENTTLTLGAGNDISLSSVPLTVTGLAQSGGGALYGPGNLTVSRNAAFTGTYMLQAGQGTTYLGGASTFDIGELDLDGGRTLENAGAFTAGASGAVNLMLGANHLGTATGSASLINDAGAVFTILGPVTIGVGAADLTAHAAPDVFTNKGALEVAGTANTATITADLVNTGTLTVDSGDTLWLDQTNSAFTQSLGGRIKGAGTLELQGNATLSATNLDVGTLKLLQGVTTLGADITYGGTFSAPTSNASAPTLALNGHKFTTKSIWHSALALTGNGRFTATGGDDTLTLGANETVGISGSYMSLNAAGGDVITISANDDDSITGQNFTLHAAAGASFAVGGNGAKGLVDTVTGSNDTIEIKSGSHIALSGAKNLINSDGGSVISLTGQFNTVTAATGDSVNVGKDNGDCITGAGFSLAASAGAIVKLGQNATGAADQATGSSVTFHVLGASNVAVTGAKDTIVSDGLSQITVTGSNNTIDAGSGDVIGIGAAADDLIFGNNFTLNAQAHAQALITDSMAGGVFSINAAGASIGVNAAATITLTGADDTLDLRNGNSNVTALAVNGLNVKNAFGATLNIGTSQKDVIQASATEVDGGATAHFTIGGNGASGDVDIVASAQSNITVTANSNVAFQDSGTFHAAFDAITSLGGSSLSLGGASCTLSAGAADTISISGAGNSVTVGANDYIFDSGSGSLLKFGGGSASNLGVVTVATSDDALGAVIDLLSGGYATSAAALGALVDDASGCHLSLGSQGQINFVGVDKSELTLANFKIK